MEKYEAIMKEFTKNNSPTEFTQVNMKIFRKKYAEFINELIVSVPETITRAMNITIHTVKLPLRIRARIIEVSEYLNCSVHATIVYLISNHYDLDIPPLQYKKGYKRGKNPNIHTPQTLKVPNWLSNKLIKESEIDDVSISMAINLILNEQLKTVEQRIKNIESGVNIQMNKKLTKSRTTDLIEDLEIKMAEATGIPISLLNSPLTIKIPKPEIRDGYRFITNFSKDRLDLYNRTKNVINKEYNDEAIIICDDATTIHGTPIPKCSSLWLKVEYHQKIIQNPMSDFWNIIDREGEI